MAPLFPLGLIAVFPNGKGIAIVAGTMVVPGLVSWVFYALLWKGISVAKKFWVFILFRSIPRVLRKRCWVGALALPQGRDEK
jgi:hypothetical protein